MDVHTAKIFALGAGAFACYCGYKLLKPAPSKLVSVRRIGDRVGRPIVAQGWKDILAQFPGENPRIFFPNGDEILPADRTSSFFALLPSQQSLYIAPNGEDFNPIEVLERLDEEKIQSASAQYNRLVDVCFKKWVPKFSESSMAQKGEAGIPEYIELCVHKYMEISKHVGAAFGSN